MKQAIYFGLLFISVLLQSQVSGAQDDSLRNPRSAKECAICHYRWIDTFFIDGKGSDLVPYQSDKVVATPDMCFSCHDGSVLDSRVRVYNDYGHKTNKPPPSHVKVPKTFPLDEKGNIQCATCHTPHGVPSGPTARESIFLRTSNKNSAMCPMCHADTAGGMTGGNHPIGSTKQEIPQKLIALGAIVGEKKNQIICETCHTAHGSPYESLLIKTGKNCGLCLACHSDKDIFAPDGKRKPFHVINAIPIDARIPQDLIKKGGRLGFSGRIICQTCHKVHNNKIREHLLLIRKDEKSTVCLTCHADKRHLAHTKHNLVHSAPKEKNLQGKSVSEDGVCSACHLPHKAARKVHEKGDFATEICRSCHSKGNVAENSRPRDHSHPLNVAPPRRKHKERMPTTRNVENKPRRLPLFDKFGIQDKNGNLACPTCHDPHRWQANSMAGETRKDVRGDRMTSFLRRPSPEICRECHSEKFFVAESKHDLGKVAPVEKNILNQTPTQSGLCGSCHLVHGAQEHFLWAREISLRSASIVQDLCTSCHSKKGMAKEKVIKGYSHPLNVSPLKKGLKTSLPLFDENDRTGEDGVMRCHTCHDSHRSASLISDNNRLSTEENGKDRFLRLQYAPSPKLCEDCHAEQAYVEGTDHDLTVTALFSKNILGQTPPQSGICGVCHLVHGSKNEVRLWAQPFGLGANVMEMMCNSCHSDNSSAKNKIPPIASHPEDVLISSVQTDTKDRLDDFPLFQKTSGKLVKIGNISCPSCHDVHQWDPQSPTKGKGINVEGDATNSFLRGRARNLPCKDCHGMDTLFRLLYFHDPSKRENQRMVFVPNKNP